jgi:hypothetical protein
VQGQGLSPLRNLWRERYLVLHIPLIHEGRRNGRGDDESKRVVRGMGDRFERHQGAKNGLTERVMRGKKTWGEWQPKMYVNKLGRERDEKTHPILYASRILRMVLDRVKPKNVPEGAKFSLSDFLNGKRQ